MNHRLRAGGLIYGAVFAILCTGITVGGVQLAISEARKPELPVPAVTAPVLAIPEAPAIAAADLWSDDRSRIETPLLDAPLEAETQWAIFERCGQDSELFCSVMAIASVESGFDPQMVSGTAATVSV